MTLVSCKRKHKPFSTIVSIQSSTALSVVFSSALLLNSFLDQLHMRKTKPNKNNKPYPISTSASGLSQLAPKFIKPNPNNESVE